ncbi:hypothetical protein GGI35DRAFT_432969 [Trichoderma velutinum]
MHDGRMSSFAWRLQVGTWGDNERDRYKARERERDENAISKTSDLIVVATLSIDEQAIDRNHTINSHKDLLSGQRTPGELWNSRAANGEFPLPTTRPLTMISAQRALKLGRVPLRRTNGCRPAPSTDIKEKKCSGLSVLVLVGRLFDILPGTTIKRTRLLLLLLSLYNFSSSWVAATELLFCSWLLNCQPLDTLAAFSCLVSV